MRRISKYVLPVAAGASLVLGLAVATPMVASAKKTPVPTIKIKPKSVANTGGTVTVTGKGFTPSDPNVNLVMCKVGALSEDQCDLATATAVTVSNTGTFTQTFVVPAGSNISGGYSDVAGDQCGTSKTTQKACGIGAGNEAQTDVANPVAVTIKPPKVKK